MASPPNQPPEEFIAAANEWDLDRLYKDLAKAKQQFAAYTRRGLTAAEKRHLQGLLCGYSPAEIAQRLIKTPEGLKTDLSKTLYRYVEELTNRPRNSLKNWRDVTDWLAEAEYRQTAPTKKSPISHNQDWGEAPDIQNFWGRREELVQLKQSIVDNHCRLVAILGIGGIGKTALAVKLAQQIVDQFDWVIWRSHRHALPVNQFLAELIPLLSHHQTTDLSVTNSISQLLNCWRQQRCLLILDNWETVLSSGQLAGNYQTGYEEYGELLERVAQSQHHSCLLLTSSEKPREVAAMEGSNQSVYSLKLEGLGEDAKEILRKNGLLEEHLWDDLIKPYRGNPLAINMIVTTIKDVFDGSIAEFLMQNTLFLGDFDYLLYQQFERLLKLEKTIMYCLVSEQHPANIAKLKEKINSPVSSSDLINALQSLGRRFLVEKVNAGGKTGFTLQPLVRKYVSRH
ncbi:MAG: NACHT domain-containing protein [Symploca sp. SIO3E6]|nr:NACHT domain-containing protein [Caldora sp. SIO3E6]